VALPSIQLGPYQLHERIGEGGNGQVYRATGPAGVVAVKLVGDPNDFDEAQAARFRREIAALTGLSHPALIALLDHGVDAELGPYLVLPMLAGHTLRDLLKGRAVCPEAALLLMLPIAEAAAALHARGFVHRDLKPENAIAAPDGTVTVIDLGLAWGEQMTRHTESGAAVGSIGYMSPEQLDGQQVDAATDVWAVGVMIYEAIVGKRPFARARPTEEVAATLLGAYAKLTAADRRASEELAELVAACLALDAKQRPSMAALAEALRAQIDWTDELAAERAAAIADPAGYQARVSAFRVRRLERTAREAIDAGKPFVALATCDRGLAYVPDHPALVDLIAKAETATAGKPKPPPAQPVAAPAAKSTTGWIIAATLVGVAGIFAFAYYQTKKDDPWAPKVTSAPAAKVTSAVSDSDKALLHDFMGMFSKALDATNKSPPSPSLPGGSRPTTAAGWLELAKSQAPGDAVTSIRQALTLSPDWPAAQDALCVALASTKDPGAIAICTTSVRRDPANVTLHAARGAALVNADRHAEALADLDAVVAADPSPQWRRLRSAARAAAGDAAGAKKDLADACQLGDALACQR
jgi:tetratricopeptide (TPR) repeat protein